MNATQTTTKNSTESQSTNAGGEYVHPTDLTLFQLNLLATIAEEPRNGLGHKDDLEAYYGETIHHGRLYPNLDRLFELGLIESEPINRRANEYRITDDGDHLLREYAQWLVGKLGYMAIASGRTE